MSSSPWIIRSHPRPLAAVRLFCLPSAGFGAAMYRSWGKTLPDAVEVCALTLPGRETLLREPPVGDLLQLVDRIAQAVLPQLDRPFALFGHSMGSWLAFELARQLRRVNAPLPARLFASGRRAPNLPATDPPMHQMDDTTLLSEIQRRYGGIPAAVLQEPELLALMLPALRADLAALETYHYRHERPLPCPLSCYGGIDDPQVTFADLEAWREHTESNFEVVQYPGTHFFLQGESQTALLASIKGHLPPKA